MVTTWLLYLALMSFGMLSRSALEFPSLRVSLPVGPVGRTAMWWSCGPALKIHLGIGCLAPNTPDPWRDTGGCQTSLLIEPRRPRQLTSINHLILLRCLRIMVPWVAQISASQNCSFLCFNHFNIQATFIQSIRRQRVLKTIYQFGQYKMKQKNWKMTENLSHGYSSESTQWELCNEHQYYRVCRKFSQISDSFY